MGGRVSTIGVKPTDVAMVEVLVEVVERTSATVVVTGAGVRVNVAVSKSVEVVEKVSVITSAVEVITVVS